MSELDQAVRAVVRDCLAVRERENVLKPDVTVDGEPVVRNGALVV
ncbi:MAG: hypothetical protein AABM66_11150 [Actinomycetota bacterium]